MTTYSKADADLVLFGQDAVNTDILVLSEIEIIHNVTKRHQKSYTITPKTAYFQTFNAKKREKRYIYKKKD